MGRAFIRTPEHFYTTVRIIFFLGVIIIPFAIIENLTDRNLILEFFDGIGDAYRNVPHEQRLGFERAQGPFAHQIHLGVFFCASIGLVYYVLGYGQPWSMRTLRTGLVAFLGATSLSAGPLVAMMAQLALLIWDGVMKGIRQRWHVFAGLAAAGFFVIDILSNRTPFHVVASYLAFNASTAYNRILIWQYGAQSIRENPVFGIGFNDWENPSWMSDSVDMFWIVGGLRHGLPVSVLFICFFAALFIPIAYQNSLGERVNFFRTGYLITLMGLFLAGWTVHYWDALLAYFMFISGAGVWILDYKYDSTDVSVDALSRRDYRALRFTRFGE